MLKVHVVYNGSYSIGVIADEYLEHSAIWRDSDMVAIEELDGSINIKKNRDGETGASTKESLDTIVEKYLNEVGDFPTEGNKNGKTKNT